MNIFETRELPLVKGTATQLSLVLVVALLLWATGAPMFIDHAHASNLSSVSDTLTNSANGLYSGHTIVYTNATSTTAGQTINIRLDPDNNLFTETNDLATSSHFSFQYNTAGSTTTVPIVNSCSANNATLTSSGTTGNLTFTYCAGSTAIAGGSTITIMLATSTPDFINPAPTNSYRVTIGGTQLNSGETRVAILPNVTLTAAIATTFTFTVSGVATSTVINGTSTSIASTATTLPFGTLVSGTTTTIGQRLNVTTNARNGFVVTVQENQPPTSGSGAIINSFQNGATTSVPQPWSLPSGIINQYNTYSHFGLTSDDSDLNGGEFVISTTTKYVGNFLTLPRQVFSNNGPADGVTNNQGSTSVAYSIAISPLQAAGNDYTNTLTYVATPTF